MTQQNKKLPAYPGKLEYPIEKENQYNTKIRFQAIGVTPPKIVSLGASSSNESVEKQGLLDLAGNVVDRVGKGKNLKFFSLGRTQSAHLHVPIGGFQVNDGFDYASSSLGAVGGAASAALQESGNLSNAFVQGLSEFGNSIFDAFSVVAGSESVSTLAALRATAKLPIGNNLRNAAQITARVTLNPNIRTNFNGVAPREFNFVFQFVPNSKRESLAVKSIIKFFRYHAYPDQIGGFGSGAFSVGFDYPNLFKIELLSGSGGDFKRIGTPIKLSYLKAISTTYNPTSPALHEDGAPTEISMGLTFVEYKAQTRQDIRDEDNKNFYDFENGQEVTRTTNDFVSNNDFTVG